MVVISRLVNGVRVLYGSKEKGLTLFSANESALLIAAGSGCPHKPQLTELIVGESYLVSDGVSRWKYFHKAGLSLTQIRKELINDY